MFQGESDGLVMLHRSTSSRRRRASRSAANSPQGNPTLTSVGVGGRRASVAVECTSLTNNDNLQERSPRGVQVPDIAFNNDDDIYGGGGGTEEVRFHNYLYDEITCKVTFVVRDVHARNCAYLRAYLVRAVTVTTYYRHKWPSHSAA